MRLLAGAILVFLGLTAAQPVKFEAQLKPSAPGIVGSGQGFIAFEVSPDFKAGERVTGSVVVRGLSANETTVWAIHLHRGESGAQGPIVLAACGQGPLSTRVTASTPSSDFSRTASTCPQGELRGAGASFDFLPLANTQPGGIVVADLPALARSVEQNPGNYYINVHLDPGSDVLALRGQLAPAA